MLSIEEIKSLIHNLEKLEKDDWVSYIKTLKEKVKKLANQVEIFNSSQIEQLDKTKNWYQNDLDRKEIVENKVQKSYNEWLYHRIESKINNFSKMGNILQNCLEIGPGYGRYTLLLRAWRLTFLIELLDTTEQKIIKRFPYLHRKLLRFYTTDRTACPKIPSNSCNFVFSWDVFPFFTQKHIKEYLNDINRVMIPGAYGFIQYADCNYNEDLEEAKRGYWNYNTKEDMIQIVKECGYTVVETDRFGIKLNYIIFKKPGDANPVVYKITEIPIEK